MKAGDINVQRQIYRNTLSLITQYGLKGWNMDDLAEMSGMAKNTLYKIVGKKKDLIGEVVFSLQLEFIELIEEAVENENSLDAIYSTINNASLMLQEYNVLKFKGMLVQYPEILEQFNANENRITDAFKRIFERGIETGNVRNDVDVEFFVKLIHLIRNQIIFDSKSPEELTRNLKNAFTVIAEGILVRGECGGSL